MADLVRLPHAGAGVVEVVTFAVGYDGYGRHGAALPELAREVRAG